jgi:Carboxypeptidase regulatory-like domain
VRVRFPRIAFLFAFAVSLALPLEAQSPNGTMNGRVLDPSNKVIGGADILVISDATGVQYSGKTNEDGIYVVPNLPPGAYRLQVSKLGFKTLIKPDIVLNIQDALSINFTLPVGAAFETVTVEGGASMINTTDASVSTVVDQTYVKNMPLNGRSFQDLILLTPGTVTQTPQNGDSALGQTGEFSVNGQRPESNYYTVDGVSANVGAPAGTSMTFFSGPSGSLSAATALGTTQSLVSVDSLQEFRVQSSTYSAEYGRNPGGQFAFETKSGANQWHGTGYDYLRNGVFDANDWFNNYFGRTEPDLRQNDFGGTLGGPVEIPGLYNGKNRTFFFVSYEGLRLAAPQAATVNYVPDLCTRGTDTCPSGETPAPSALQQALNAFPVPNGPDVGSGISEFIASWTTPGSLDSTSVRIDHVVSDRLRLFFRFSDTESSLTSRTTGAPSGNNVSAYTMRTYTAGATGTFNDRLNNEFRLNYSSNETTNSADIDTFGGSTPANLVQLSGLSAGSGAALLILSGGFEPALYQLPYSGAQRQWNFVDTLGFFSGHHQFKFGVDFRRLAPSITPANPSVFYIYLGESFVEMNNALTVINVQPPDHPMYLNFSAFAQDEWKVSERVNLSMGLRWEVNPAPGVTQGLNGYTIQGSSPDIWTLAPQGTPLWRTTWYNIAPRLGVAYILHNTPGRETVVRGGGGVFFDTGQQLGALSFNGPGFDAQNSPFTSFPAPVATLAPSIVNPPVAPYSSTPFGFASHLQLPYTLQWNGSIEQEVGKSQALTISYVGSHAARLLKETTISTPTNPNSQEFIFVQNGLTSDYHSLQLQFRRRLSRGLTGLASYTWSHCIDYGSQNYDLGYQRGNCAFDVRQNLSTAFSYDLPHIGNNRFSRAVLHNWGVDDRFTARTGFPVTLSGNPSFDPATLQLVYSGLNLVSGQPIYLYGANCASILEGLNDLLPGQGCPGGRAVNPNAFTAPTSGLGNAPRNFVRGFGAWQMDMAIRRDFPIHEGLRVQFRAEAFNIFNHPNFGTINPNLGQNTFGQATGTLANSLGVLSPLYQMGGPRSMQFALKLVF